LRFGHNFGSPLFTCLSATSIYPKGQLNIAAAALLGLNNVLKL
jgi:hypothetical protein